MVARGVVQKLEHPELGEVSPGGLSLGSLGPVSEGVWVWMVGLGSLIAIAVWVGAKSS